MDINLVTLTYVVAYALIGIVFLLVLGRYIKHKTEARIQQIKKIKRFHYVKEAKPEDYSTRQKAAAAIESTKKRFSIIYRIALVMTILIILFAVSFPFLNTLPKAAFSIITGLLTIIIGIAAKPFLENLIAGIQISFSRPFKIGDTVVIDDQYGTVEDITLIHTFIKKWDWPRYIVPNSVMLTKAFYNYTNRDRYLWAHVSFWVSYDADMTRVKEIAVSSAKETGYLTETDDISFWVMDMAKEGIECWVAAWVLSPSDAWMHKAALREDLITRFQKEGIQSHMHHFQTRKS